MRLNLKALILTLVITVFSKTLLAQLSYREYRSIRSIGEQIMDRFPPEDFQYVGLGASPTAIIAYLESVLGPEAVTHLPLTNGIMLARHYELHSDSSPHPEEILNHHFDTFLPHEFTSKKNILVIDFANTGLSLQFVHKRLTDYLLDRPERDLNLVTLALGRRKLFLEALRETGLETLRLSSFAYHLFLTQRFDEFRRFRKLDLSRVDTLRGYKPPEINRSPLSFEEYQKIIRQDHFAPGDYDHLLRGLQLQMKKDPLNRDFYSPREFQSPILYCHSVF
jgi:hypothetical protein